MTTKTTIESVRAAINNAQHLGDLVEALRSTSELSEDEQDRIDWTDLPTFGGAEPSNTLGVWSWDHESLLVGSCADDLTVIDRPDGTENLTFPNLDDLRNEVLPVYHHYEGQTEPQLAYLELDEHGAVSVDWDGEIGNAMPMSVWHKRDLRWTLPSPLLRGFALSDFLDDQDVRKALARVHAGRSIEWDGSNKVGRYTPDAEAAIEDVRRLIDEQLADEENYGHVWSPADWLEDSVFWLDKDGVACLRREAVSFRITVWVGDVEITTTIDPDTPRAVIADLAKRIEASALERPDECCMFSSSVDDYLDDLQQELARKEL